MDSKKTEKKRKTEVTMKIRNGEEENNGVKRRQAAEKRSVKK